MAEKATPSCFKGAALRPWTSKVEPMPYPETDDADLPIIVRDAVGKEVAFISESAPGYEVTARLIVQAVNSHDALVDALDKVLYFGSFCGGFTSRPAWFTDDAAWSAWVDASEDVRAALALAKQEAQ